nr:MAG: RNA-dependent RNA polymerase [Porcine picobirnavirus]
MQDHATNPLFTEGFILPNAGLRAYFDRVEKGSNQVIRTSFYDGVALPELVGKWLNQLESLKHDWPTLFEYEYDQSHKVGPMSVMKPLKQRMADIDSYYADVSLSAEPIQGAAIKRTLDEFVPVAGLRVRNIPNTIQNMRLSTNSGAPFFTRKRRVLEHYSYVGMESANKRGSSDELVELWYSYYRNNDAPNNSTSSITKFLNLAILGWRGQEGGPKPSDVKQRVVWMFPMSLNVEELRVYQPLIEAVQNSARTKTVVPAWVSMELVDEYITKLIDTKAPQDLILCTDFSRFDQHFNSVMASTAYDVLSDLLTPTRDAQTWLSDIYWQKYNIPLAYDWDKVRTGYHGMASGSGGTNADETLAHRCLQHEVALLSGQKLNPYSQCLGDDGILSYPGITVDKVVKAYSSHGQECNPDKQYASREDCIYLRRWHHRLYRENGICVGVYPTIRALGRLCMQERYYDPRVWGPKMVALRQLSILENVKHHPLKEQFVEFCMKGDKYRLGMDIPGFLDNIGSIAAEATANMPDFLSYSNTLGEADPVKGIADWWVVKYLKSKA